MLDPKSSSSGWLLDLSALVNCLVGSSFIQHEVSLRIYLVVIRFWSNGSKRICTLLYCTTSQTSLWDKLCRLVIKLRSAPIENKQDLGKAYPQFLPSRGSSGWRSLPSHHSLAIDSLFSRTDCELQLLLGWDCWFVSFFLSKMWLFLLLQFGERMAMINENIIFFRFIKKVWLEQIHEPSNF